MTKSVGRSVSAAPSPGLRAGDLAREPRVFCILGSQRTGSNLLVSLLNSHHEVACHWEVFLDKAVHTLFGGGTYCPKAKHDAPEAASLRDVKRRDTQPEAFLDELLAASRRHYPEAAAIGFKILLHQNPEMLERVIENHDIIKVVLERENKLDQYASQKIALMTGQFSLHRGQKRLVARADYEHDEFLEFVETELHRYRTVRTELESSGQSFISLSYNAVAAGELNPLLTALDVRSDLQLYADNRRQNRLLTRSKFTNPDVVLRSLAGSPNARWIRERYARDP